MGFRKASSAIPILAGLIVYRLLVSLGAGVVVGTVAGLVAILAGGEYPNRAFWVGLGLMAGLMFLVKMIELFQGIAEEYKKAEIERILHEEDES